MIKTDIIDEIINCGITSEDTILNFGAGYKEGLLIDTLCEYWGVEQSDFSFFVGIDVNSDSIQTLSKKFINSEFWNSSMQEYLDNIGEQKSDWCIATGVFNEYLYGNNQYDYVFQTISRCLEVSNKGFIFTLNQNISDSFSYSSVFIFAHLISNHSKVFVKKFENNSYIFCILK